jgi:hypothetical protein
LNDGDKWKERATLKFDWIFSALGYTVSPPIQKNETMSENYNIVELQALFRYQYDFISTRIVPVLRSGMKKITIIAPPKCGKKNMKMILGRLFTSDSSKVFFTSAYHRRSDESQRHVLKRHGLCIHSLIDQSAVDKCVRDLRKSHEDGSHVILCIDEADHGSQLKQDRDQGKEYKGELLAKVHTIACQLDNVQIVYFTATAQEILAARCAEASESHTFETFPPPPEYCGFSYFLDNHLVNESEPALGDDFRFSEQILDIIHDLRQNLRIEPARNFIFIRLSGCGQLRTFIDRHARTTYRDMKFYVDINEDAGIELTDNIRRVDAWDNREYWTEHPTGDVRVILVQQKCSRSTEIKCHDRIFAFHDHRTQVVSSTVEQSYGRMNHYYGRDYPEPQKIRMYVHVATMEHVVGRITTDVYISSTTEHVTKVKESPRTQTSAVAEVEYHFYECMGPQDWGTIKAAMLSQLREAGEKTRQYRFDNPFHDSFKDESGQWTSNIGVIVKPRKLSELLQCLNYGIGKSIWHRRTICYRDSDNQLGILLRWSTGGLRTSSVAVDSMHSAVTTTRMKRHRL